MKHFSYTGSGPYCYSNSFSMMFGDKSPPIDIIEFATSSAFGMHLLGGTLPFFDPYGWTPEASFDDALAALGWTSDLIRGDDPHHALALLEAALADGPVWVGPVEMGLLKHQPGQTGPIGADHYLVVIGIEGASVLMHDPEGFPYVRLPLETFLQAWRTETLAYGTSFTMRHGFRRVAAKANAEIIRAALPAARAWLSCKGANDVPPGTVGNGEAAEALADMIENDLTEGLRDHLVHFAVRVGARRAADAAACLMQIGETRAAAILDRQSRLIGSLQYLLVTRDDATAAGALRALAPTYDDLLGALPA